MGNIKITLETLYDILRNEKKREDLQELDSTFFQDVVSYLIGKKNLLDSKENSDDIFAAGERDKLEYELKSIKKILKEIYDKREKKIIDIAMNRSRTGSDIIDTSYMLKEEKEFYERVLRLFNLHRRGVLLQLFNGKTPDITPEENRRIKTLKKPSSVLVDGAEEDDFEESEENDKDYENVNGVEEKENTAEQTEVELTKIRFLRPVPSFIWKDMKTYGPFDSGEETEIFPEIANLLERKGRIKKI